MIYVIRGQQGQPCVIMAILSCYQSKKFKMKVLHLILESPSLDKLYIFRYCFIYINLYSLFFMAILFIEFIGEFF